jgi:hypothetical protein
MLENLQVKSHKPNCSVRSLYDSLSDVDKEILMSNLCDPAVSSRALAKALAEVGVIISKDSIQKHRNSECSCSKI